MCSISEEVQESLRQHKHRFWFFRQKGTDKKRMQTSVRLTCTHTHSTRKEGSCFLSALPPQAFCIVFIWDWQNRPLTPIPVWVRGDGSVVYQQCIPAGRSHTSVSLLLVCGSYRVSFSCDPWLHTSVCVCVLVCQSSFPICRKFLAIFFGKLSLKQRRSALLQLLADCIILKVPLCLQAL